MKVLLSFLYLLIYLFLQAGGHSNVNMETKIIKRITGQSVVLDCSIVPDNNIFFITWTESCGNRFLEQNSRMTFTKNKMEVTLTNLTEEDTGMYYCQRNDGKTTKTGQRTMLQVIDALNCQGTNEDQCTEVGILYITVGIQTCIIIVPLAMLIKKCLRGGKCPGSSGTKEKYNKEEETQVNQELHYADILRKMKTPHSRTRQMEDTIVYAAINSQQQQ